MLDISGILSRSNAIQTPRNAIRPLLVSALLVTTAIGLAAPAAADQTAYLQALQPTYPFLTDAVLMSAAHTVCSATGSGWSASEVVPVVSEHFELSVSASSDITREAIKHLGC